MKKRVITLALIGLVPALATAAVDEGWYLGAGPGLSRLDPDTSGTMYDLDDGRSSGGKLFLGYDWDEKWSIEGYYSVLGSAEIDPSGEIDYTDMGVHANYYFYRGAERGEGLSAFAHIGLGSMQNSANVPYQRDNDTHLMGGLGAEYGLFDGWALRADLDLYDRDAQLFTVSLMKRFGEKAEPVVEEPTPVVAPPPEPEPEPVPVVVNPDLDGDGILNEADACPNTPVGTQVDERGCKLEEVIVLEGVVFASGSDELIGDSHIILNNMAATLKRYPEMQVEVGGHTDWQGKAPYNQKLSERRAKAVRSYLIEQGVNADNLSAKGYGEIQPIADNKTAEGRAKNRRVELQRLD